MTTAAPLKNVVVVGGSYVGLAAAKELISVLPKEYRVIVLEPHSHFGHLFAFPRFALTSASNSTHKAFIPYTTFLPSPHLIVRAKAVNVLPSTVTLDRPVTLSAEDGEIASIPYEALALATGTKLTPPGNVPSEGKLESVQWFTAHQEEVAKAKRIVIVGGGAVGVQMATDIPILFPNQGKEVTVVHSRAHLMPRFHPALHEIVLKRFSELGVKAVLGSRAKVPSGGWEAIRSGGAVVCENGATVEGDLVIFATGQTPLSDPLKSLSPSSILPSGFVKVKPTLQIDSEEYTAGRVFALGDIAESGGAKAARPGGGVQAPLVARNVLKILEGSSEPLEVYKPDPAAIHLTLGIVESVIFRNPPSSSFADPTNTFIGEPESRWRDDGKEDMGIEGVWARRAPGVTDFHL